MLPATGASIQHSRTQRSRLAPTRARLVPTFHIQNSELREELSGTIGGRNLVFGDLTPSPQRTIARRACRQVRVYY